MKKILLLSDTHSYIDQTILKYVEWADEVWHAGDIGNLSVTDSIKKLKPLRAVYGNIDDAKIRSEFPLNNRFNCEGIDVLITHIAGYPNKYNSRIISILEKNPPKILVCGHSHILIVMQDKSYKHLHLNPGAAGIYGNHQIRTMLRFIIEDGTIKDMEVIEIKK